MREGMKLAVTLMLICGLAGLALSFVNEFTSGRIAQEQERRLAGSLPSALAAEDYLELEDVTAQLREQERFADLLAIWETKNPAGYVVQVAPTGYGGRINCLVGISQAGVIQGVVINQHSETPGLGSKIVEDSFLDQYKGNKAGQKLAVKNDGGKIAAVSGATVSSRAVTAGVNTALAVFEEVSK